MLVPKSKLPSTSNTHNNSKVSKPYSILSMGLLKTSINSNTHRSREIPNTLTTIKTSEEISKMRASNKTQHPNCTAVKGTNHKTSTNIPHDENSSYICNTLSLPKDSKIPLQPSQSISLLSSMQIDPSEDIITTQPHVLKLNNLTNQEILNEDIQKKQTSLLDFIFDQSNYINQSKESPAKQSSLFVDMKKKIKKLSRSKKPTQRHSNFRGIVSEAMADEMEQRIAELTSNHSRLLTKIYPDREIITDMQGQRGKLKPQHIDNDVDTDDEQVNAGIKRLHRSLTEAVQEFQPQPMEEDLVCSPLQHRSTP